MSPVTRTSLARRAVTTGAAVALSVSTAAATLALTAGPASASPKAKVHATYKVTGSTFLKGPNSSLALGPGTLAATLNPKNGKLTATLTMPPATGSFKEGGVIPVTATAAFINDGNTTGTLNLNTGAVTTTSNITLQLTSLVVAGIPIAVGHSCETAQPVVIQLTSQKGFNILKGGKVAGEYTIGNFHHCGLATLLINLTIPASGNTISLKLGKAKIG
jgi:hypothetical protein